MSLEAGRKLGPYEIIEPIGKGGMGEVYRARDTKLDRDVAIKVLPDEFAQDKERLDRFEREARLLAQLNHANVATLHGLETQDCQQFLVMELVEGETLAERIEHGAVPIHEAVPLFVQITEGLEAAHEKGIIHRDLKPANIKLTPEGKLKILDFGLAKAFAPTENISAETSQSPTLTKGTALGAIMGTAAYMSPEQARGKPVDKRADIWAYGCCLYESLVGRRPFEGDNITACLPPSSATSRTGPRSRHEQRRPYATCSKGVSTKITGADYGTSGMLATICLRRINRRLQSRRPRLREGGGNAEWSWQWRRRGSPGLSHGISSRNRRCRCGASRFPYRPRSVFPFGDTISHCRPTATCSPT